MSRPCKLNLTLQGEAVEELRDLACRRRVQIHVLMLRALRLLLEADGLSQQGYQLGFVKDRSMLEIEVIGMWAACDDPGSGPK